MVIVHDRWGLDDGLRNMADRIAGEGYIVLAIDLFGGETTADVQVARELMISTLGDPDASASNIEGALGFLSEVAAAPSVAALGIGFGGTWNLSPAGIFPDRVDAAISYYGQVSDNPERLDPISAPMIGFFGEKDLVIRAENVRAFEAAMQALDKDGRQVATFGSEDQPKSIALSESDYDEDAWVWWAVGSVAGVALITGIVATAISLSGSSGPGIPDNLADITVTIK